MSTGNGIAPHLAPLMSSDSPEWYTPPEVIKVALETMGGIDLDPAADPGHTIPARHHYTQAEDGLGKPWALPDGTPARVYLNPPYGRAIPQWVAKLIREYDAGHIAQAVALLPARPDTRWYRSLARFPRCYVAGRLRFSGHQNAAPFPSALVYLGPHLDAFLAACSGLGDVYGAALSVKA